MKLNKIHNYLTKRIEQMKILESQGVLPGTMDSIELQQLTGRIKEAKLCLLFIEDLQKEELTSLVVTFSKLPRFVCHEHALHINPIPNSDNAYRLSCPICEAENA